MIYVWLDALLNYITAIGWSEDEARFQFALAGEDPADRQGDRALSHDHLARDALGVGRERAGAGVRARLDHRRRRENEQEPRKRRRSVPARSNASAPMRCVIFCCAKRTFGSDFSYSEEKIAQRCNSDLANDLGNLLKRASRCWQRYRDGVVPAPRAASRAWGALCAAARSRARSHVSTCDSARRWKRRGSW